MNHKLLKTSLLVMMVIASSSTYSQDINTTSGLDSDSMLPYLFGIPGNTIFGLLWFILASIHLYQTYKSKVKWTLALPIGELFSDLGYFLRIACRSNQESLALYAVCYLFVILSPAAFLAFNYMTFSRIIISLDDEVTNKSKRTVKSRFTLVPPRLFAPIFVGSDITTFLIQAAGGGLQASASNLASVGNTIFLIGVVAQAASYVLFTGLLVLSHIRIHREGISKAITVLFCGLYFSGMCILIRLFFRIVESAEGYNGKLYTTEIYLFCLDALPLVLANLTWVLLWPPKYIERDAISRQGLEKNLS